MAVPKAMRSARTERETQRVEVSSEVDGDCALSCKGSREATRTLLSTSEESPVLLEGEVDLDESGALQQLDNHTRGDDGGDTELHERSTVGGENHTHPVQRVCRLAGARQLVTAGATSLGALACSPDESDETIP